MRSFPVRTIESIDKINFNQNYFNIKIYETPDYKVNWKLVKVLDDKQTSTQAYAFKKDDEIVLAYRGSQEAHDWIDTDGNYLVLNANKTPAETQDKKL